MSIVDDVRQYYQVKGIAPENFHCKHLSDCKRDCDTFTKGQEPYIGREYEKGTLPRLLFLSLDPVQGEFSDEDHPEQRTIESYRAYEENVDLNFEHKGRHWYRTHEFALKILQQFNPDLSLSDIRFCFAHANSAKCCMHRPRNSMGDFRIFANCREFIPGELAALRPDIVVTQGDRAKEAVLAGFASTPSNPMQCGHSIIDLGRRRVLWIHTYHPGYFRGFNHQRSECWSRWAEIAKKFIMDSAGAIPS